MAPAGAAATNGFTAERSTILRLAKLEELSSDEPAEGVGGHAVLPDGTAVFVPLGDAIDVDRECARLREELDRIDGQLRSVAGKLANEKFVARAPAEVVERERGLVEELKTQIETVRANLEGLGA